MALCGIKLFYLLYHLLQVVFFNNCLMLQQLFNAADIAVVGQFSGSEALAAVGANSAIINLLVNLFVGLSVGANVAVASFVGQNNKERVSKAVHTSILISLISGVVLFFIGVFQHLKILLI